MIQICIRISRETHDRLIAEARRRGGVKNKSELARLLLEAGLDGREDDKARHPESAIIGQRFDDLRRLLQQVAVTGSFTELALIEFLGKKPGLADELRRRARELWASPDQRRGVPAARGTEKPATTPPPTSSAQAPRTTQPSRAERIAAREAEKRRLIRELTEED